MPNLDIAGLVEAVSQNRYFITTHAKERMGQREVFDEDVKEVIALGEAIEQHAEAYPFPKALFMMHVRGEPLYVSCAFDGICSYYYCPLV